MSKIITITFNPALDKSMAIPKLVPEKKLKCSHQKVEPGGGGINVSRAMHKLGGYSEAVYLSGGYTGKQFEALLIAENIVSTSLPISGDTRENFIIFDEVHYMRDRDRGVVWEESIILLPNTIKLVFLSATLSNSHQFAEWIHHIKETSRKT